MNDNNRKSNGLESLGERIFLCQFYKRPVIAIIDMDVEKKPTSHTWKQKEEKTP